MNEPETRSRYEYSLLDLCGRIHGSVTGSGDRISPEEAERMRLWLNWRIGQGWEETLRVHRRWLFDNAVRALCFAALFELTAELELADSPGPNE